METKKKFDEEYGRAKREGERANAVEPRALSARYDPDTRQVIIRLMGGGDFAFSPELFPNLRGAAPGELEGVEVTPSGEGLHWESLDEDLSVPALLQGAYGPRAAAGDAPPRSGVGLPEGLCAQLETAWVTGRDDAAVDRLAAEHPEHAEALYDFFALLVECELAAPPPQADAGQSAARTLSWLWEEGFALANRISREESVRTPEASPDAPAGVGGAVGPRPAEQAQAAPLAYLGLLQERTGRDVDEITAGMDVEPSVIKFVQRQPADKFKRVRGEIVRRGAETWGVGEEEGAEALAMQLPMAALRRSSAESLTYEQVISRSGMSAEKKRLWLELASEG
ncbi:MAG: DUF2442 domain-containing protein [Acidobacteria bacterium]|nr:DUF2442 domain-containing protein [Acidobacteriota bacterium]